MNPGPHFTPSASRDNEPAWIGGERSHVAILVVDLVESTRLMRVNPDDVIARWQQLVHDVEVETAERFQGTMIRSMGDGLLLTFPTALNAVRAAFHVQRNMPRYNVGRVAADSMFLRISIHVDTVLFDRTEIHGLGVALATRLLGVALPGDILCSAEARDDLVDGLDCELEDLGPCYLKHLPSPVRAYRVRERQSAGSLQVPVSTERPPRPDADELRLAIAVLPFDTHADTPECGVIGDLIADQTIAALSCGAHLKVISRLSSRAVLNRGLSGSDIAACLGVAYVVSGRLLVRGDDLSLVVELSSTSTAEVLWAERVVSKIDRLLSKSDPLASSLAASICSVIFSQQLAALRASPLPSLQSYSLLLGSVSLMHRFSAADFARAKECLEALVERAPRHAVPYAWSARWHVFRAVQGWSQDPADDRARARDLCRRALDLDPDSSLALTVAGSVEVALNKDLDRARQLYLDALQVDPNEPLAWALLGTSHSFKGEGEEAMRCCTRAVALTPLDPMRFFYDNHLAAAAVAAGEYDTAIALAKSSLRANRMHHSTLRTLGIAQSMAGRMDDARATVGLILQAQPGLTAGSFLRSFPGSGYEHGKRLSTALRQAGLPE